MKLNRLLGVFLIVGSLMLNSCSVQTREVGFGGGNWSMPKISQTAMATRNTVVDSVYTITEHESEKELSPLQFNHDLGASFNENTHLKFFKSKLVQKEINKEKAKSLNRLISTKDIGKSMGWASIILGIIAGFVGGLFSLLLAVCGVFVGLIGLKIGPGFIGRLLCYAGIAISIFSVIHGIIGALISLLILVALILLLLLLLKKV